MFVLLTEHPVLKRSIKSSSPQIQRKQVELAVSSRKIAVGAVLVVSLVVLAALLMQTYALLQDFNPIAAMAAILVIVIGTVWLVKTAKP
jgi:hypothetical protein